MEDNRKGTWEDVTGDCTVDDTGVAGFVEVRYDGVTVGWLGHRVESSKFQENYRMTSSLDPEDARDGDCGAFMVEHFIPDPEPVIAYKAVIERDGEWVSTFAGSLRGGPFDELTYRIGETTTSTRGTGIHCADTLKVAKRNYPPANSDDRREGFDRKDGRVVILKVEGIGAKGEASCMTYRESVVFPSVKVLSVAWEEEKKEEWVDVTKECKLELWAEGGGYNVNIKHNGSWVFFLGPTTNDPKVSGYRVTFPQCGTKDTHTGTFKIEKRND